MRFFSRLWQSVDAMRRFCANLLFLVLLIAVAAVVFVATRPVGGIPPGTVLVLALDGTVSETAPTPPRSVADVRRMLEVERGSTRLLDVTEALAAAQDDASIAGVVLDLENLSGIGLASARTIGEALEDYKRATGRPVLAWGSAFSQGAYAVAAHADEIYVHPMGTVELKGLTGRSLHWGEFLKRLSVEVDVYKAGVYKSAPEAFLFGAPSEETLEAQRGYLEPAWTRLTTDLETARNARKGAVNAWIDQLASGRGKVLSDPLGALQDAGLVTGVMTRDAFVEHAASKFGSTPDDLQVVDYRDYLAVLPALPASDAYVALVTAEGEISNEPAVGGIVAGDLIALLEEATSVPETKALVLRINTPGGDALAAEEIREKIEAIRKKGLPVVVSMGDAAASGGYWLSASADVVVADPLTLTGSIGVFALAPNFAPMLEKFDVGTGGWSTGPVAEFGSMLSPRDKAEHALYQAGVERVYANFRSIVARGRNLSPEAVEAAAGGRVWLGEDAKHLGLVDELGTLDDAVRIAAERAGLGEEFAVHLFDPIEEGWGRWLAPVLNGVFGDAVRTRASVSETLRALCYADGVLSAWEHRVLALPGRAIVWAPQARVSL